MPIHVTCPGCLTKFTVAEKFAGQKGPCKKCKTIIEIPKLEDQVVIHAPEHSEAGAVGAGGQHVLKTFRRTDAKFKPLVFAGVIGVALVVLLVALVLRGTEYGQSPWVLGVGAVLLGPLLSWAGYTFLRDPELEGYEGPNLWLRSLACGLVYALLWGVYLFIGNIWFGPDAMAKGLELWQLVVLVIPIFAMGTMAAYVAFDLEPGSGFFHAALYFTVTVLLRMVMGMPVVPGFGAGA